MVFTICLSHDVDRVSKTYQYITHDLLRGRLARWRTLFTGERPYWGIDRLMEMEDAYGVRSTFFFLEESISPKLLSPRSWMLGLGRYRFSDARVGDAIRRLDAGGWEVGLHGSYLSYRNLDLLRTEKASLEAVLGRPVVGIRQHFLNLEIPETWHLHRKAGLAYDASFGLKNNIGFRDDRYHVFRDEASGMVVIPLALMEGYLWDRAGGNLERAWDLTLAHMDEAEAHKAVFTVLWHQRMVNEEEFPGYATIYERIIREGLRRGARFMTCRDVYHEFVECQITASP